jgi:hypothetical protein
MNATTASGENQQDGALTPAETKIVQAYRSMSVVARTHLELIAPQLALDFPLRARSALRLVAGGAA